MKIFCQLDHLSKLTPKSDSSLALLKAAYERGYNCFTYHPTTLAWDNGEITALLSSLSWSTNSKSWEEKKLGRTTLANADIVLIRQNPPFNMEYLHPTYLLERLPSKVKVINSPSAVRNNPEKLIPLAFPESIPSTIITQDVNQIKEFVHNYKHVVLKPIYAFGGQDVFLTSIEDVNLTSLVNMMTNRYNLPLIAQNYIPEVVNGDIRVIIAEGQIIGQYSRRPAEGEIRSNTVQGASIHPIELNSQQLKLCENLADYLRKHDIWFAGVDLIGSYLIEVNITSPTGILALDELYGPGHAEKIWKTWLQN